MNETTPPPNPSESGDPRAAEELLPEVYAQLRQLARRRMARESAAHTLQPTALVHEAWLRLGGAEHGDWKNRGHFFGAAAEAMRRILVERARRRQAQRHGGGLVRVNLADFEPASDRPADDETVVAVHRALESFARIEPRKAELVKLRFFGGLTLAEAAAGLGVSEPTAKRWWSYARAWLFREISRA
ncbi:MAG TPA: ECF-type sigma factor [Opitutaceae bacterium]|nr:ECF-type sigma factor [Opitutaceae bacterium]